MSDPGDPTVPPPQSTELAGRKLGDFQLLRRLGRGAMAEVYLAEQASLQRRVAVKVLKPELAADEREARRFVQAAQSVARLKHPNIVQVYDVAQRTATSTS